MTDKQSVTCKQCAKVIDNAAAGYAINALDASWHKECFNCSKCGNRLFSFAKFFNQGGYPVCKRCNDLKATDCGACGKKIEGKSLQAHGKNWHPSCFQCHGCAGGLSQEVGFFEDEGRLWHLECFAARNG